jgi:hypothetical protein
MSNEGPPPALLIRAAIKARRAVPDKDKLVEPADYTSENLLMKERNSRRRRTIYKDAPSSLRSRDEGYDGLTGRPTA